MRLLVGWSAGKVAAVVTMLEDSAAVARSAAVRMLGTMDVAALAQHLAAITPKLEDSDADTRLDAVKTLGKLDTRTLAQHEQSLAKVAEGGGCMGAWEERNVREAAAQLLAELRGLGD